jgi:uncharacterized protein
MQGARHISGHSRASGNPEDEKLGPRNGVPNALARWGAPRGDERINGLAALFVAAFLGLFLAAAALALTFPALTDRVVDEANILDAGTRAALTQKLADLEAKTTDQLVVVTLKSLQGTAIEEYGVELGRRWQIGQKEKNNGVLLIVAPNERKVRIEVGYGLEGALTDAVTRLIIENAILPRFRAGDFAGGIARGVDDIISVLSGDAEEWQRQAAKRPDAPGWGSLLIFLLAIALILFFFWLMSGPPGAGPRRRGSSWGPIVWAPSSGSSWDSGGGFSGGGFSGGGGSFGGGGASGSW